MNPLILVGNRQTGKTTQLVNAVKENENGILVVASCEIRRLIIEKHKLDPEKIITHLELKISEKLKGVSLKDIYIDDVELFFREILGNNELKGLAITLEGLVE